MPNLNAPRDSRYRGWYRDDLNNALEVFHGTTRVMSTTASATTFDLATTFSSAVTFSGSQSYSGAPTFCNDVTVANTFGLTIGHPTACRLTISDGDGCTNLIPEVQILGTAKADSSILLASFNTTNTSAVAPSVNFLKGGTATIGAVTTPVAACEVLGEINWFAHDAACGDFESSAARIDVIVAAASGANDVAGAVRILATEDGSNGPPLEKVRVTGGAATSTLRVGVPGTSAATLTLASVTACGQISFTVAACSTGAYTLPTADAACAGFQLTCNASGVLSWAAASLGEFKNDNGVVCTNEILQAVVSSPVHKFTYDPEKMLKGHAAPPCDFIGIFGEEAPWAMQGERKRVLSLVNSVGALTASIQALNARLEAVEARS